MPVIVQKKWFTTEQIEADRDIYYLFGDNVMRKGTGGQAKVCRDQPNCIGVVTKLKPDYEETSYMSDDDYDINVERITLDLLKIYKLLKDGKTVIFPYDGIGTGVAELPKRAPKTYEYIQRCWNFLVEKFPDESK